jgi:hypothetical protein
MHIFSASASQQLTRVDVHSLAENGKMFGKFGLLRNLAIVEQRHNGLVLSLLSD